MKSDKEKESRTFSEYEESDEEINAADFESDETDDSLELGEERDPYYYRSPFAHGYCNGKALNNSFTGPYSNMDHIHQD